MEQKYIVKLLNEYYEGEVWLDREKAFFDSLGFDKSKAKVMTKTEANEFILKYSDTPFEIEKVVF
jgi:hypothetical protein